MKRDRLPMCFALAICIPYALSFFLPVYHFEHVWMYGWQVFDGCVRDLARGSELVDNARMFAPNPLLWIGLICLCVRRPHFALVAGCAATALAAYTVYDLEVFVTQNFVWWDFRDMVMERCGAYLWLACMLLLAAGGLAFTVRQWRQTRRLPMLGEPVA
jgi:hypothetical protein